MRYLSIIFLAISCSPYHKPKTEYSLPPELADCKIFVISDGSQELYVVKCPTADTTTSRRRNCGKNCSTVDHVTVTK